jgi:hypothetical protein
MSKINFKDFTMISFKGKIYNDYSIDKSGKVFDKFGVEVPTKINPTRKRPYVQLDKQQMEIHRIQAETNYGYKKGYIAHHINEDILDNRLENILYVSKAQHASIHFTGNSTAKGLIHSKETREKISNVQKGNTNTKGRVWVNNGERTKMCYINSIPDGYIFGRLKN